MSVSPQIGTKLKDDRQYLSPFLQILLSPFLVSNPNEHKAETRDAFFMKIARDLIKARDLEIISIWSPTYLLSLLDFIDMNKNELGLDQTMTWKEIWPNLKLISCWDSAQAKNTAEILINKFPGVKLQGKGLLLTEAPITIPWSEARGQVPLVTETFLEFINFEGQILGLHELKKDERYRVLTSQFNGYLRYETQDEVLVTGHYFKTPILEFMGRTGNHSDLAGEKLSESMLQDLYHDYKFPLLFVPDTSHERPRYIAYVEVGHNHSDLEKRLMKNYHYELASTLNQLLPLKIIEIKHLQKMLMDFYQNEGMVLGDIKERLLINDPRQAQRFHRWTQRELQPSHSD